MTPLIFSQFGFKALTVVDYISLIAATTNAFNGALLARRPDHYRHFTVIGVVVLAYAGGIGGGIVRDVLVNKVPAPLTNPWYLILCLSAAWLAIMIDFGSAQKFKDGLFQFMTAFSLPWYAIVGAQAALAAHLGYAAAVIIGVIATTAGRWIIDTACLVVPKQLVRGEFFMMAAILTGTVYVILNAGMGVSVIVSTLIAFFVGFGFRLTCQTLGWEEWEPWEPEALTEGEKARKTLGEG
ncbi:MAG TPA: TRIC cation channel family protein, partial [Candidatus Cybelea sp.]